jgi:hypothetical protein
MVLKEKSGLFSRFRRGKTNKLDAIANSTPESATPLPKSESPTLPDDTDATPHDNSNVGDKDDEGTASQLKAVRFPASDALKTTPGRSRRELQKAPTAREAAYGGPPRYDWIDIVSVTASVFDLILIQSFLSPIACTK